MLNSLETTSIYFGIVVGSVICDSNINVLLLIEKRHHDVTQKHYSMELVGLLTPTQVEMNRDGNRLVEGVEPAPLLVSTGIRGTTPGPAD